jgi:hypothetical protein
MVRWLSFIYVISIVFNFNTIFCTIEQQREALSSLNTALHYLSSKIVNYSTLEETVKQALKEKSLKAFDIYSPENILVRIATDLVDIVVNEKYGDLGWCDCSEARAEKRILLIVQMVDDIILHHPDKQQEITLVSLGSGDLLQEYLLVKALIKAGYNKLVFNIIDTQYQQDFWSPSVVKFIALLLSDGLTIGQDIIGNPLKEPYVKLGVWPSGANYRSMALREQRAKADVFMMVDLATVSFRSRVTREDLERLKSGTYNFVKLFVTLSRFITVYLPFFGDYMFIKSNLLDSPKLQESLERMAKSIIAHNNNRFKIAEDVIDVVDKFDFFNAGFDRRLLFLDLIRQTARDPNTVIAYELNSNRITKFVRINETFHSYFLDPDTSLYSYNPQTQSFQPYQ